MGAARESNCIVSVGMMRAYDGIDDGISKGGLNFARRSFRLVPSFTAERINGEFILARLKVALQVGA